MSNKKRPYSFYAETQSLCEECLELVPAKIVFQDEKVFYLKRCKLHGVQKTLVSTDIEYFKQCKDWIKPGDLPNTFQTRIEKGCPHDCGLCPDHEQHSCLALFEIIDECNMHCPVCFAMSGPGQGRPKSMQDIEAMLAALIESEYEPDLVQVSGGEPTLHPKIKEILSYIKQSPVRHLMLNTNGIRIAQEKDFVQFLANLGQGFEVYLQFDSLNADSLKNIRGIDARRIREQALENLEALNISTTLVCVLRKGVNDTEVGELIEYAKKWKCIRGVTFQPVQDAGRNEGKVASDKQRLTLSEIRQQIIAAENEFQASDMIPLPCHPENICIGYALKTEQGLLPVSGLLPRDEVLKGTSNTITFEQDKVLKEKVFDLYSLDACSEKTTENLQSLLCCLPKVEVPEKIDYSQVFRVVIMSFMDRYDFDIASIKRSCVHFIQPDGKIYPFETWNMFYRQKYLQQASETELKIIKAEVEL